MVLRVIGAGLGRTGTNSLKLALERLLGGPCHHMFEVAADESRVAAWETLLDGGSVDWDGVLAGYVATVDWPAAAWWRELAQAYPDAPVLLSTRDSAAQWWESASTTIFASVVTESDDPNTARRRQMIRRLFAATFDPDWQHREAAVAAYDAHNAAVRAAIPPGRLVEWQPGDGWGPLVAALGGPAPQEPFPHVNTGPDFRRGHLPADQGPAPGRSGAAPGGR